MKEQFQPLYGSTLDTLLENPDRGFRLETKLDVFTGDWRGRDACEITDEFLAKFREDRPKITQHYFYLTGYRDRDLDNAAFARMNRYFDYCRARGIKVLLRFAYVMDDQKYDEEDAETEQILRHIDQMQEFITQNRDVIYAYQAGYVGAWGEWSGAAKQDRFTVLNHLLDRIPDDLPVMVRYVWIKNVLGEFDLRRARVSYHDDYILDEPHQWNTGAKDDSPYYEQLTQESRYLTIDGEMPWASDRNGLDGIAVAKRLAKHHFTTFSIEHNYQENRGSNHSFPIWKTVPVTPELLSENNMPCNPHWFTEADGTPLPRSCYEYMRDYLGYQLYAKSAEIIPGDGVTEFRVEMINYGFSAPHSMKELNLVLLDDGNRVVAAQPLCKKSELQSGETVNCTVYFRDMPQAAVRYGIELRDYAGKGARFANDCEFIDGINVLGSLR